jgi:hypothetical protein
VSAIAGAPVVGTQTYAREPHARRRGDGEWRVADDGRRVAAACARATRGPRKAGVRVGA